MALKTSYRHRIFLYGKIPVRAPVFGRHQFFGTSEHYGKAHGSLLSGWMNYNYTASCWFPTSSNILILPSQIWQIRFESYLLHCSKCRILVLLRYMYYKCSFRCCFYCTAIGFSYTCAVCVWDWRKGGGGVGEGQDWIVPSTYLSKIHLHKNTFLQLKILQARRNPAGPFKKVGSRTTPHLGTIPHWIKIKPSYCPPGPRSLGLVPTRTTPHQTTIN